MLDDQSYERVFKVNKEGEKILQELIKLFYNKQSYVKNDPYETAFNEGSRKVIKFIINKIEPKNQND